MITVASHPRGRRPDLKVLPDLSAFVGSGALHFHPLDASVRYTDGVEFLADRVGAHWLIDKIAACQSNEAVAAHSRQFWRLSVARCRGTLACRDADGSILWSEQIPFSDFPAPGIELVCVDEVIMLPAEFREAATP